MGAKLGFYIGWEYDEDYDARTNRTYKGIGLLRYWVPPFVVPIDKRHEYRQIMNITIYLCDSPGEGKEDEILSRPIVIRRIKGEYIINVFAEEYPGGLEEWAKVIEAQWAGYYTALANEQVAGLVPCECPQYEGKSYKIEVTERKYIPPVVVIPKREKEMIEYFEERKKESEDVDEAMSWQRQIDAILERYR